MPNAANNGHLSYITELQNYQMTLSPDIQGKTNSSSLLFFTSY